MPDVEPVNDRYTHYRDVVLKSMPELMSTSLDRWFKALSQHFHSDYFFATEPHDERDCPFSGGDQIALSQTQTEQRHPISA